MQVLRQEKGLKKNRSKDVDFNPKANTDLPVHVLLFSSNKRKKKKGRRERAMHPQ